MSNKNEPLIRRENLQTEITHTRIYPSITGVMNARLMKFCKETGNKMSQTVNTAIDELLTKRGY